MFHYDNSYRVLIGYSFSGAERRGSGHQIKVSYKSTGMCLYYYLISIQSLGTILFIIQIYNKLFLKHFHHFMKTIKGFNKSSKNDI